MDLLEHTLTMLKHWAYLTLRRYLLQDSHRTPQAWARAVWSAGPVTRAAVSQDGGFGVIAVLSFADLYRNGWVKARLLIGDLPREPKKHVVGMPSQLANAHPLGVLFNFNNGVESVGPLQLGVIDLLHAAHVRL